MSASPHPGSIQGQLNALRIEVETLKRDRRVLDERIAKRDRLLRLAHGALRDLTKSTACVDAVLSVLEDSIDNG